jgi:hypothetical protein
MAVLLRASLWPYHEFAYATRRPLGRQEARSRCRPAKRGRTRKTAARRAGAKRGVDTPFPSFPGRLPERWIRLASAGRRPHGENSAPTNRHAPKAKSEPPPYPADALRLVVADVDAGRRSLPAICPSVGHSYCLVVSSVTQPARECEVIRRPPLEERHRVEPTPHGIQDAGK